MKYILSSLLLLLSIAVYSQPEIRGRYAPEGRKESVQDHDLYLDSNHKAKLVQAAAGSMAFKVGKWELRGDTVIIMLTHIEYPKRDAILPWFEELNYIFKDGCLEPVESFHLKYCRISDTVTPQKP